MKKNFYNTYLNKYCSILKNISFDKLNLIEKELIRYRRQKNKVLIFGNGGSASIASHFATDLVKMCGIRAFTISDFNFITCMSNDYGFDKWIKKAIEYYASQQDLIILISSSGNSKNMITAAEFCKKRKINLITVTGFNKRNKLKSFGKINFWVDSNNYNFVENVHQTCLLAVVDKITKKA